MHLLVITVVLAIVGLLTAFVLVGIIPSIAAFCLSIYLILQEKSINIVRALLMSVVGILVPVIMYLNCYGFSLPYDKGLGLGSAKQIIYDNYSNMGLDMSFLLAENESSDGSETAAALYSSNPNEDNEMYYVSDGVIQDSPGYESSIESTDGEEGTENDLHGNDDNNEEKSESLDYRDYPESIFESFEDIEKEYAAKPKSIRVAASDDDMPSYGGLPVGTLIVAQYFREDDHNCNPVLVLQNETGSLCRYECMFTARNDDGDEIAVSEKTSEVVPDGAKFVIEGRFDKSELGGVLPSMYEFTITKRQPYEKDMTGNVAVYTKVDGNSVILAAENTSDIKVKVDAYVLFFDGDELVDCIWLIPQNVDEVCISPLSVATIQGDAYYRFDRTETYYTAYEAIEGN